MSKYEEFKKSLLEDGIIDANEVVQLRKELYADGIIDKDEADFLFELNDATSGAANDPSWDALFVEAICDFLLKDEISPGEVDDNEAEWLLARIVKDGVFDANEKALIAALKAQAKSLPTKLVEGLK